MNSVLSNSVYNTIHDTTTIRTIIPFHCVSVVMGDTTGYLGDSVTLSSGANLSWILSKIEWSIFSNNTWIATYRKETYTLETYTLKTDRFWQFQGRLRLNISSGDLEIRDVRIGDALVYSVLLKDIKGEQQSRKLKLTVTGKALNQNNVPVLKVHSVGF